MPGKLSAYHAKRNFRITDEPKGRVERGHEELRFVVQKHDASTLHYDFRLELDGTLKSWAIPKGPSMDPSEKRLAVQVEDHPISYAGFEGVIPEHQYGAGRVEIWDSGYWEPEGDATAGYRDGKLKFHLYGEKLQGGFMLLRTKMRGGGSQKQWLLIKERDDAVRENEAPQAVTPKKAKRSAAEPAANAAVFDAKRKSAMPRTIAAQLATLVDEPPSEGKWIYEIKYDGYRILARIEDGDVRLYTRDGKDWTAKLPKQVKALQSLKLENAWLDGEIVVLDDNGVPSFQRLQNAFDEKSAEEIVYFVFDLPYLDGEDLRNTPLLDRHRRLAALLLQQNHGPLRYSAPLSESPGRLLKSACDMSMEGLIGKRQDSLYTGKRSGDWIKLKCRKRQEFVIVGYTDPQGTRKRFGSLILGVYGEDGKLHYAGRVGTGFDSEILESVYKKLKPLARSSSPFANAPRRTGPMPARWVKPELVAEISFAEWTKDGMVRQAVFHGLRIDKPAAQVRRENAVPADEASSSGGEQAQTEEGNVFHGVTITHPDRVIDPSSGLTKLDLARYYDAVSPFILPYLEHRPVYLLRSPSGIDAKGFFQRHAGKSEIPGITILDPSVDPEHQPLMVIGSLEALLSASQMGAIELHTCNATADSIDRPDYMVLDLDPDPALPWAKVVEGARIARQLLIELGLTCFLKTSGSKGLHLVVPLARRHEWKTVTDFSEAIARHLAKTIPSHFSATMGEQHRIGKIYVDFLRNQKMASTVAPYSVRARKGLSVSAPLSWEELDDISGSAMWNIVSLPERLQKQKKDPWAEFGNTRQIITKTMMRRLGIK